MSLALVSTPLAGWRTSAQSLLCDISQITFTTGGSNSNLALSDDGAHIAFLSNRDLTGANADGNFEIFLYNTQPGSFTQITNSTAEMAFTNFDVSISGNGTRIAFLSTLNLTGGNADGNGEVFLFDAATFSFTQVTDTTVFGGSGDLALSDEGTRLAFRSSYDLTGGNPDGNQEILLYNTQTGGFTQLTNTTGINNFNPTISGNGTRVAFESLHHLTGGNPDGNFEIFLYDAQAGDLTQVTDSTAGFNSPTSLDDAGTRIGFHSKCDLTGDNADLNTEIFLYDSTSGIAQVTNTTGEAGIFPNFAASISGDGTRLTFLSNRDLTGGNADGNDEIIIYDTQAGSFTQVTDTTGEFNGTPSITGDGSRIAFVSNQDLTGGNPDLNVEIFLGTCRLDSDDDGIPDDSDPDTVADVVIALPDTNFQSSGNKNAFLSRLEAIEQLILDGKVEQALQELQNLRRRVDGCGSTADTNDWIIDCAAQLQVRALIDMLIGNL
jgi:Tol biopolymer transport system component